MCTSLKYVSIDLVRFRITMQLIYEHTIDKDGIAGDSVHYKMIWLWGFW